MHEEYVKECMQMMQQTNRRINRICYKIGSLEAANVHSGGAVREFGVYSQSGEDGVIQWLVQNLDIPKERQRFVEFGVEDYAQANTRFLLMHDNWSGLIMDCSRENMEKARKIGGGWFYDLTAVSAFITRENINDLIRSHGFAGDIGLLSVDIDGNDYWVWRAIDCVRPDIVVAEYNSRFGVEKAVTIPYDEKFYRMDADPSGLYFGASIRAMVNLAHAKGYALVYGTKFGINAFFVRRELLNDTVCERSVEECYVQAKYRQALDKHGKLRLLSVAEEEALMAQILERLPLVQIREDGEPDL